MEKLEIFLSTEQPATCSKCGNRTEIITEFELFQQHKCLSEDCNFQFILEFDQDIELCK